MNRALRVAFGLATLLILFATNGCSETATAPGPPKIIAGESRDLVSEVVSSSGGIVYADLPGDSLDGLEIDVPAGAYGEGRTFRVSASPITSHEFGSDFNPLTPLIKIENGGGYSAEPMTLKIPCTIPDGHFAMAFIYDRATGQIEGVPTIDMDESSITILTYNFDFSTIASAAKPSMLNGGAVTVGNTEVVISSIPEAKLADPFDSEFRPDVDGWQFPNYGSHLYIGHCSGMSATSMWYYAERKKKRKEESLFGRLDNDGGRTTPQVWADDVAGFRFTGMAQVDLPWGTVFQRLVNFAERNLPLKVTYNLFAYAIRITKLPQFVWIRDENSTPLGSHAMVIYRVENGKLYIYDPNYRGVTDRMTEYSLGQFLPYYSGPNAQNVGVKYTRFYYIAYSSVINTKGFNQQWPQVVEGSIGENRYPGYSLYARDENRIMATLSDGFTTRTGILELEVRSTDVPLKISAVYNGNEQSIPISNNIIRLPFGEQRIGIHITNMNGQWVGFQWIQVTAKEDATDPDPIPPSETSTDCVTYLSIDDIPQHATNQDYKKYPDNTFSLTCNFLGGFARMTIRNFTGPGTYELYWTENIYDGGSVIAATNGSIWYGGGTMKITRYDAEAVAGTFTFESKIGTQTAKKATGTFQCLRQ